MTNCRNRIGTIPSALGCLSSLKQLDLSGNALTGESTPLPSQEIPLQCGNGALAYHAVVDVDKPNLSVFAPPHPLFVAGCIPPEIGNLECLQLLNLASNCLSGEFQVVDGG